MVEPNLFPEGRGVSSPLSAHEEAHHVVHRREDSALLQGVREHVNETASRLSVLEERAGNLRKKTQVIEQGLLEYTRETRADLKALGQRLTELARTVEDVKEKIDAMTGELGSVVKKHEIDVLERYLDLWEPLSFVTREEAKMLLKDAKKQ